MGGCDEQLVFRAGRRWRMRKACGAGAKLLVGTPTSFGDVRRMYCLSRLSCFFFVRVGFTKCIKRCSQANGTLKVVEHQLFVPTRRNRRGVEVTAQPFRPATSAGSGVSARVQWLPGRHTAGRIKSKGPKKCTWLSFSCGMVLWTCNVCSLNEKGGG